MSTTSQGALHVEMEYIRDDTYHPLAARVEQRKVLQWIAQNALESLRGPPTVMVGG